MARKRSVFDIDFQLDDETEEGALAGASDALETKSFNVQGHPLQDREVAAERRGPMASAISETLEASEGRAAAEAAIRAENDALAHEHVRLKKLGLITDLLPTDAIRSTKLIRDRSTATDPDLTELKVSIQSVGLSNPIRVEQTEDGYELVQGFRRLNAFRELAQETGDPRYRKIPAALVPRGEPLEALYRKMVDENLVRKDISFGEMAQLAISYAQDSGGDADAAVGALYGSALKQKRRYIRQFVQVLTATDGAISHPEAIPRALGLELYKAFEERPGDLPGLISDLRRLGAGDAAAEVALLRAFVSAAPKAQPARRLTGEAKTSLRLPRPEGEARVLASDGRVELRLNRDFSLVPKAQLQAAIEAFLSEIADDG